MSPYRIRYAVFIVALVAFVVILFKIAPLAWPVLKIFILAGLVVLALDGPVRWQVARGIPRWVATLNLLLVSALVIGALIDLLMPPLFEQFREFKAMAPTLWAGILYRLGAVPRRFPWVAHALTIHSTPPDLLSGAGVWMSEARSLFTGVFGAVTAILLIFVTTLYTLLNPRPLLYGLRGLFPASWLGKVDRIAGLIAIRLRAWVIGTLALSAAIGVMDYLALVIINHFSSPKLPFILFFAILGGMLEIVPIVGPLIAAVLPSLVGFAINPLLGVFVLVAFLSVMELEGHILVPLVMQRAVRLHPVTIIFSLVMLTKLFGIFGALIAVPVASSLKVLYDEWYYPLMHNGCPPQPPPPEQAAVKLGVT